MIVTKLCLHTDSCFTMFSLLPPEKIPIANLLFSRRFRVSLIRRRRAAQFGTGGFVWLHVCTCFMQTTRLISTNAPAQERRQQTPAFLLKDPE